MIKFFWSFCLCIEFLSSEFLIELIFCASAKCYQYRPENYDLWSDRHLLINWDFQMILSHKKVSWEKYETAMTFLLKNYFLGKLLEISSQKLNYSHSTLIVFIKRKLLELFLCYLICYLRYSIYTLDANIWDDSQHFGRELFWNFIEPHPSQYLIFNSKFPFYLIETRGN